MSRTGLNQSKTNSNNIDALLGKQKPKPSASITKAIKLSEEEIEQVNKVSKMLGTTNFSDGLRHCIDSYWTEHGNDILRICNERDAIKPL